MQVYPYIPARPLRIPPTKATPVEDLVRERGWSTRQVGAAFKRSPM
jgi:hypothetical protein